MMVRWQRYSESVQVPTAMINEWFGLNRLRLISNMEVDTVLALDACNGDLLDKLPDQERFPYYDSQGMLMIWPGEVCW